MWPESDKTAELLLGAKAGHDGAVNRLMERHREGMRRFVQLRLDQRIQRRVDVSDIVQDALLEAHRRLHDYLAGPPMPFHLWVRQIAKDRIIDAHRRHRVSGKRSVDREQALAVPAAEDRSTLELAAWLCDPEITPAAAAAQKELVQRVQSAIAQLDEADFEVVAMRHYEKLSNLEVAQALGLSEPAASMRYLRAIRRLRAALGGDSTPSQPA